jgi:O-acetyl-ADP-ribose deacetylase (regulator of RNase III)
MPIVSTIKGDLIKIAQTGKYSAIVHGCNIHCTMGAGIAPQIAEAWPQARDVDNRTNKGHRNKLGKASIAHSTKDQMFIFNAYIQDHFRSNPLTGGPAVEYDKLYDCFRGVNEYMKGKGNEFIGIPMIGAGLAGGDWNTIETLINVSTPDIKIEVVEYQPETATKQTGKKLKVNSKRKKDKKKIYKNRSKK